MRGSLGRLILVTSGALLIAAISVGQQVRARSTESEGSAELDLRTLAGSYLAGRLARNQQDTDNAADFYRRALSQDTGNEILLEQAFQMEVMTGAWAKALPLANQLSATQQSHRISRFLLGVAAFKAGNYTDADEQFRAASENPIGELTSAIARGWTKLAAGDVDGALAAVDVPKQPDWAQFYLRYHRGLIADLGGRKAEARSSFEKMFRQDGRTLRTALAYAQHAAHHGDLKLAKSILKEQLDKSQGEQHPLSKDLQAQIDGKKTVPLLVTSAADGLSEVFYGLGEALTGEGGISLGTIYLQLALYAKPDHAFALAALASSEETAKHYERAIATYERIPPGTALQEAIDIRKAFNLNSLERVDEAKALLDAMSRKDPRDVRPLEALGNIMRARKRYAEAVGYFSKAIDNLGKPEPRQWGYYYARGTAYERLKNWPAAEADLKRALQMSPEQPLVLNYLGYSWIDQSRNMKDGMKLIEKAVQLKPDDGYIVDSLGWAHYKQGNYRDAVRFLERAVEIKPEDPTLNDHLGDALWMVGREREAKFQWGQAISLSPEPEDLEKIKAKLDRGLPVKAQVKTQVKAKQAQRVEQSRRRSENRTSPEKGLFE